MIEYSVERAVEKVENIIRVIRQVGDHPTVSPVETGSAVADLEDWLESLKALQRVSSRINLEDIDATEEFLKKLEEGNMPYEEGSFLTIRHILEQQRKLAALQNMELGAIQESLQGTDVSFGIPAPIRVGNWLKDRGYVTYQVEVYPAISKWSPGDLDHNDTYFGVYRHQQGSEEKTVTSLFGRRKYTKIERWVSVERVCSLDLASEPWQMRICGRTAIPEALILAQGISKLAGEKIDAILSTEKTFSQTVSEQPRYGYSFGHFLPRSY